MEKVLLETLKTRFEDEQRIKESLENKAANLIAFIAIIVTIYTGFFSSILTKQTTFWTFFLFWLGIIFYLLSGILSLFALVVRWGSGPLRVSRKLVIEWKKKTEDELYQIFQTDYLNAVEDSSKGNDRKAFFVNSAFVFAILSVIITVFLLVAVLLSS